MKLSDHTLRKPFYVAFGQAQQGGGITSVDLVATRDATTVTMTASDGSAAPIAGADASAAGIMTAIDKSKLDSLPTATAREFAAKLDAATSTISAGVTHLRTAGHSMPGDGGGALYKRAASEPLHNLKVQSADLAWWELVPENGAVNVLQAGAVGDGLTDNHQAFLDAILAFPSNVDTNNQGAARVIVPEGEYFIGSTLDIHASVILEGQGVGAGNGGSSVLKWPADTTGIIIQRVNTTGLTIESPTDATTKGGDGTIIRNLRLEGSGSFGAAANGIHMRARATVDQCVIVDFSQDGIHIVATSGSGDLSQEGNANNWNVTNCRLIRNKRHGMHVDGADVNAGTAIAVDSSSNGRWGIYDSSFLGNAYFGCHVSTNGQALIAGNPADASSTVSFGGSRYAANVAATEADLVATEPGTDEAVWYFTGAGGVHAQIPLWVAAKPEGTYFHGGAYRTDNANARNTMIGCYSEGGQGPSQIVKPTIISNGLQGASVKGSGFWQDGNIVKLGNLEFGERDGDTAGIEFDLRRWDDSLIYANVGGDHASGTQLLVWNTGQKMWDIGRWANLTSRVPMGLTTNLTTNTFGRAATVGGGYPHFGRGFFLGSTSSARMMNSSATVPTTGDHARGEICWNRDPSVGGVLGWTCTTAGTPGTWTALAVISKTEWDTAQTDIADLKARVTALEPPV
jgi:hypothetical protein